MSTFRDYTLHLLDGYFVEGICLTSKNTVGVVEVGALEAAQKEIAELKSIFSVQLDILEQNKNLTVSLKVAEDALRLIASPDESEPNWFHLTSRKALAEIQKIKKELG